MANAFVPADVKLEERAVGQLVERRAREFGDKAFVETTDGETMSYRELHERSNRLAHGSLISASHIKSRSS